MQDCYSSVDLLWRLSMFPMKRRNCFILKLLGGNTRELSWLDSQPAHRVSSLPLGKRFRAGLSPPSLPSFGQCVVRQGGVRSPALHSFMLLRSHGGADAEEEAHRVPSSGSDEEGSTLPAARPQLLLRERGRDGF